MKQLLWLVLPVLMACTNQGGESPSLTDEYISNLRSWREAIFKEKRETYLALVARYPLKKGDTLTLGSAPSSDLRLDDDNFPVVAGSVTIRNDSVFFSPADGVKVALDSVVIADFTYIPPNAYPSIPTLSHGRYSWHFMNREGNYFLRIRDAENPAIDAFAGYEWFGPDPSFILDGWISYYDSTKTTEVPSVFDFKETSEFIAQFTFEYLGESYSLDVQQDGFVMFSDQTSGQQTYGAGRYLYIDLPEEDGEATLDFNYAYNPPCIFSKYTTCQFAPVQNRLPFPVLAGEKNERARE